MSQPKNYRFWERRSRTFMLKLDELELFFPLCSNYAQFTIMSHGVYWNTEFYKHGCWLNYNQSNHVKSFAAWHRPGMTRSVGSRPDGLANMTTFTWLPTFQAQRLPWGQWTDQTLSHPRAFASAVPSASSGFHSDTCRAYSSSSVRSHVVHTVPSVTVLPEEGTQSYMLSPYSASLFC